MPLFRRPILIVLCCLLPGGAVASESAAPARDNVPRIWRALSGDRVELDQRVFDLHGVTCPAPDTDRGRQAKALLNTFMLGTKHAGGITCTRFGEDSVDCRRNGRKASDLMVDSGLCHLRDGGDIRAETGETLRLTRHDAGPPPVGYWRLRSCLGVHPDDAPTHCRLASRTWPLRYAQAVQYLDMRNAATCSSPIRPTGPVFGPRAGHAPPNRYSLRPFWFNRCHGVLGGHRLR